MIIGGAIFAAVITAGLLLGGQAAHYTTANKFLADRTEKTTAILEEMGTIKIGDRLPDHRFEDFESNPVWLSDLLSKKTLVSFYYPDCEACVFEFERLQDACLDTADYALFLFISAADPQALADHKRGLALPLTVLCDQGSAYSRELGIFTYPFNVIVNRDRIVMEIIADALQDDDFKDIIKANDAAGAGRNQQR
jgi:peroxiredoxin